MELNQVTSTEELFEKFLPHDDVREIFGYDKGTKGNENVDELIFFPSKIWIKISEKN